MSTQDIMQYASFGLGIFGVVIAILQGFERRKLKQFMHSQAWNIFSISQFSFGSAQLALKTYKEAYKDKINPDIFEQLSKCDAYNINLFMEAIRQIQLSEPKFDIETISTWKIQGRINSQTAAYFIKAMAMKSPGIPKMAWDVITLKIRQKLTKFIAPQKHEDNSHDDRNII